MMLWCRVEVLTGSISTSGLLFLFPPTSLSTSKNGLLPKSHYQPWNWRLLSFGNPSKLLLIYYPSISPSLPRKRPTLTFPLSSSSPSLLPSLQAAWVLAILPHFYAASVSQKFKTPFDNSEFNR